MRMPSYSCSCYWRCKTGCSYTLWYWSCWCILEKISSDHEMIAPWLCSFSHEVTKGRADSVIRVTQWWINMVTEARCGRIWLRWLSSLSRQSDASLSRAQITGDVFIPLWKGLQCPAIILWCSAYPVWNGHEIRMSSCWHQKLSVKWRGG